MNTFIDPFEFKGEWFLPSNPDESLFGNLEYDGKSLPKLSLRGAFHTMGNTTSHEKFIHGLTDRGKKVTLYKCSTSNLSMNVPGIQEETIVATIVFFGYHFQHEKEIRFDSFSFSVGGLEEWLGYKVYNLRRGLDVNEDCTVTLETPKNIKYELEDYDLFFNYTYSISGGNIYRKHLMTSRAWIKLDFHEPIPLSRMFDLLQTYSNFLSLCMGHHPALLKLQIQIKRISNEHHDVFYYLFQDGVKTRDAHWMPLSYRSLSDNFQTYIENWFVKRKHFEHAFDVYFSTLFNMFIHPIHEFLSLVTAFESYYREKTPKNNRIIMDVELFSKLSGLVSAQIIDTVKCKKTRQMFLDRLVWWNEKSLRKKMNEIYNLYKEGFDAYVTNKTEFINKIVNTRNYYTHYSVDPKKETIPHNELRTYSQTLKLMLYIMILKEIQIEGDLYDNALNRWIFLTTFSIYSWDTGD